MKRWWYNIQNPTLYQGQHRKKDYFEGWYYKIVHPSNDHAFALISGVSIASKTDRHAFIQLMDGTGGKSHYYRFDFENFKAAEDKLVVNIDDNIFSDQRIKVDLPDIKVDLDISDPHPLQSTFYNPGIMGWFSFTPKMQCYHGIVSMHHKLDGKVIHNGQELLYDNGTGYIEKDWGTSFPKCWFWTHCNTFDSSEVVSVMASVAHIPWMGNYFIGFIVALQIGNKQHRFATYNESAWKANLENDTLTLQFKKGKQVLTIQTQKGATAELISPIHGEMTGKVNESLQAQMHINYKVNESVLLDTKGQSAGLEIAGDFTNLLAGKWRYR